MTLTLVKLVAIITGRPDSSPGHIIQMIRGLLFAAIIQIIEERQELSKMIGPIMLSPNFQKEVIDFWFHDQPEQVVDYSKEIILGFRSLDWIMTNSEGSIGS